MPKKDDPYEMDHQLDRSHLEGKYPFRSNENIQLKEDCYENGKGYKALNLIQEELEKYLPSGESLELNNLMLQHKNQQKKNISHLGNTLDRSDDAIYSLNELDQNLVANDELDQNTFTFRSKKPNQNTVVLHEHQLHQQQHQQQHRIDDHQYELKLEKKEKKKNKHKKTKDKEIENDHVQSQQIQQETNENEEQQQSTSHQGDHHFPHHQPEQNPCLREVLTKDVSCMNINHQDDLNKNSIHHQKETLKTPVKLQQKQLINHQLEKKIEMLCTNPKEMKEKLSELECKVLQTSEALVKQGEKNLKLGKKLESVQSQLQSAKNDVQRAREVLLEGIIGTTLDVSLYQHVALSELVRLRLQKSNPISYSSSPTQTTTLPTMSTTTKSPTKGTRSTNVQQVEKDNKVGQTEIEESSHPLEEVYPNTFEEDQVLPMDSLGNIGKMDREMRLMKRRNKTLQKKLVQLEEELQQSCSKLEDMKTLKQKTMELTGKHEKEHRSRSETATKQANEKILALSEHIEKLMVHLKHEAAGKAKALDHKKKIEKEMEEVKETNQILYKKLSLKEKTIREHREKSQLLEDQLQLMDQKYTDIRNMLDWTRSNSQKEVKRLQNEIIQLHTQLDTYKFSKMIPLGLTESHKSKNWKRNNSETQLDCPQTVSQNRLRLPSAMFTKTTTSHTNSISNVSTTTTILENDNDNEAILGSSKTTIPFLSSSNSNCYLGNKEF